MTVRPIYIIGEAVLHRRALEVTQFDDSLRSLVADMFDTMDKAPGVGLAAPQVGVGLRVFVYNYADEKDTERRGVIINPELEVGKVSVADADWDTEAEGCLSVPGERFPLKRADWIRVTGVDLEQRPIDIEATGWFARIFQHEFDHLDGTLYVDKLTEDYLGEAQEAIAKEGWGKPGLTWLPGVDNLED